MFDYKELKAYWWLFLVSGLLSVFIGAALMFWPGKTLAVVGWFIGFWMLFFGVLRIVMALFGGKADGRWVILIVGIVGIVLGIVVMKNPAATIGLIALIAAIFWIISGIIDVFRAITDGDMPSRGWVTRAVPDFACGRRVGASGLSTTSRSPGTRIRNVPSFCTRATIP